MRTDEKTTNRQEQVEKPGNTFCCGTEDSRTAADCCKSTVRTDGCCSMMSKGMSACRWFPLIPAIIGIALLLVGYYVNAEITRVMWMLLTGFLALLGLLGLLMAGRMKRICCR